MWWRLYLFKSKYSLYRTNRTKKKKWEWFRATLLLLLLLLSLLYENSLALCYYGLLGLFGFVCELLFVYNLVSGRFAD